MSSHWIHITASYALVLGGFLALAIATTLRHGTAKRRLAQLDTRAGPRAGRRGLDNHAAGGKDSA